MATDSAAKRIEIQRPSNVNSEFYRKLYNLNFGSLVDEKVVTRATFDNKNVDQGVSAEKTDITKYCFKDNVIRISVNYAPFKPGKVEVAIQDNIAISINRYENEFNSSNHELNDDHHVLACASLPLAIQDAMCFDAYGCGIRHTVSRKLCWCFDIPHNCKIKAHQIYDDGESVHLEIYLENDNTNKISFRKLLGEENSDANKIFKYSGRF